VARQTCLGFDLLGPIHDWFADRFDAAIFTMPKPCSTV
jgi:hypothetical protein